MFPELACEHLMRTMRQQEDEAIKTWPKRAIMLVGVVVVVAPTVINVISLLSGGGGKKQRLLRVLCERPRNLLHGFEEGQ